MPGRAEAALEAVLLPEGLLQWVEPALRRQSLDGRDRRAVGLHRQHGAALDGHAVDDHGAGAALAGVAADVGAGEVEILAQQLHEHASGLDLHGTGDAIDDKGDLFCHREPPALDGCGQC